MSLAASWGWHAELSVLRSSSGAITITDSWSGFDHSAEGALRQLNSALSYMRRVFPDELAGEPSSFFIEGLSEHEQP